MGSININFAEVEGGFDAIPAGLYPVVIEKVEVRESKSSEHDYFNWEYTITEGDFEARKLWQITSLSPNAVFRLKDQLMALGVIEGDEEMDLEWDEDVEITPQSGPLLTHPDVSGMAAVAVVTIDTWEGKERNRVDELRPEGAADDTGKKPGSSAKKSSSGNGASAKKTGAAKKSSGSRRALR